MDDEIQFGEVEEASPQTSLRPDRNKHYAVVEYGSPDDRDLPIFVDLDVLADMEDHALSDTSVELGGVLLGQTCTDDAGRPFIVITDSLRAQHYESTKGSFTFTHDTWSAITRERDAFPGDLAMVGWYHTHPDWGVFLSGMDMFICDNFFNKPLDLAYVIDPCRGDRGMFQWTGNPSQRVRRTGGFFVTASRFRAAELEYYVAELSGTMPATSMRTSAGSHGGAPVVHLHQPPQPQPPAWQAPAVMGMLCLQFCLLALIAWRMIEPRLPFSMSVAAAGNAESQLAELKVALAAKAQADAALEKLKLRTEMLDEVTREIKGTAPGFVERLQEQFDQTAKLTKDVEARDGQIEEQKRSHAAEIAKLHASGGKTERERDSLLAQVDDLNKQVAALEVNSKELKDKLAKYEPPKPTAGETPAGATDRSIWWYVGGGILAAVIVIAGVWFGGKLWLEQEGDGTEDKLPSSPPTEPRTPNPEP